jgi:hypothetical protein
MTLRRITSSMGLSLLVVFLLTPAAHGLDPHFVKAKASVDTDGQLVVDCRLAGIGNNVLLDAAVSAHAVAVYDNGTVEDGAGADVRAIPGTFARTFWLSRPDGA